MLSVKNLVKSYQTTKSKTKDRFLALKNVSIDFPETGFVFLLGKSGSGKSTLLNCIGGLDNFDSGEIIIKGKSSKDFSQSDFDSYRNTFIGFIFQEYNILENFSVAKNLAIAIELQGKKASKEGVESLLSQVEMLDYAKRKPNQLSGGQKQRVAIARALIKNPEIIMADEPTGALDSTTGKQVMDTLKELSKTKLVIVVSHDRDFAETYGDRIIELKDGKIISDTTKKEIEAQKSNSGMSIVEGKYIHVKKGQQLSDKELKEIGQMIVNNAKNSDTIISLDGKVNEEVKKTQGITDDGNQETFLDTKPEDINIKQYNPKDLKLIRSRLKFSDSFKMGTSALKSKVWKLVFTILLSFIAFTMFGVIDALSCWNRADSVYKTIQITGQKYAAIKKQEVGEYGTEDGVMRDEDIVKLQEQFSSYKFSPVLQPSMYNFKFNDYYLSSYYSYESMYPSTVSDNGSSNLAYNNRAEGIICLTEEDLAYYGLTIEGRLPQNSSEIAISKYFYTAIKSVDNKVNSYSDIECKYQSNNEMSLTVVGVIDDQIDLSEYNNISASEFNSKELMKDVYAKTVGGFSRLIFVDQTLFNYFKENSSNSSSYNQTYYYSLITTEPSIATTSYYQSISNENVYKIDDVAAIDNIYIQLLQVYNAKCEEYNQKLIEYNQAQEDYNNAVQEYYNDPEHNEYPEYPDVEYPNYPDYNTYMGALSDSIYRIPVITAYKNTTEYISDPYRSLTFIDPQNITLGENEIIVSSQFFVKWYDTSHSSTTTMNDDEIRQILNSGAELTLEIYQNGKYSSKNGSYEHKNSTYYKIVGVTNSSYGSQIIANEETYNKLKDMLFSGYYQTITKLTGTSQDKALISAIETFNSDNVKYPIQNSSTSWLDMLENLITELTKYLLYVAIGFAVFASLLLMNFISNSISYKKREIGVLRALGARGSDIFGIFFNESAVIAMINFVISAISTVIICLVVNTVIIKKLGLNIAFFNPSLRQIGLILGISILSAFIASIIPVSRFSHKKPIDAINNR